MRHRRRPARHLLVASAAGLVAVIALGVSVQVLSGGAPRGVDPIATPSGPSVGAPTPGATTPPEPLSPVGGETLEVAGASAAVPVEVRVPSLGITSALDDLPVLPDGTLAPPPRWQVAGWYDGGPRPGEIGPAVIAGHVDSKAGPAVFADLGQLEPGDLVEVDGDDGSTTTFRVDRLEDAPKDAFPTEAVYGQTPDPQLRLITCSGAFDRSVGHYEDNLIVFATRVTP